MATSLQAIPISNVTLRGFSVFKESSDDSVKKKKTAPDFNQLSVCVTHPQNSSKSAG